MALLVEDELAARSSIVVAIVEPLPETRVRLESSLQGYAIGRYASIDELEAAGSLSPPMVVVLGPSGSASDVGRLGALCRARSGVGGVLVIDTGDPSLLRASFRAGLADAVVLDEVASELNPAVSGLAERLSGELDRRGGRAAPQRRSSPGRVTAVFSPKGGVGKSAIAVNLATVLARDGETVVLVDLDLQFGDIAVMLRLQPQHTIAEIASADDVDEDLVRSLLVEHEPSGVWVLAAPTEPSMAEHIDARAVARLLDVLRGLGRRIIVDTPPILSDVILQLLVGADDIAFVVGMDVPSVKNARIGLHALRVVGIPSERVVIVLNRADSKVNLAVRDVERAIERKIDVRIPSDVIVTQSINKGTPAALDYERSHFARSLAAMGETLSARELEEASR